MTRYFITAWCDRPFYAQCEVDAETPEEALAKARVAMHDAPAEECDNGYPWDEWRVDTAEAEGVLLHSDESARINAAAPKLLEALSLMIRWTEKHGLNMADLMTGQRAEVPVVTIARKAIALVTGRTA